MSQTLLTKWRSAVVAGLATSLLLAPAGAARASGSPERATGSSAFDAQPVKRTTATCPRGTVRYAGGGAVDYGRAGGGGVALTGIVPDDDGDSVTVTAAASPGHTGNWSVTAFAICETSVQPWQVVEDDLPGAVANLVEHHVGESVDRFVRPWRQSAMPVRPETRIPPAHGRGLAATRRGGHRPAGDPGYRRCALCLRSRMHPASPRTAWSPWTRGRNRLS